MPNSIPERIDNFPVSQLQIEYESRSRKFVVKMVFSLLRSSTSKFLHIQNRPGLSHPSPLLVLLFPIMQPFIGHVPVSVRFDPDVPRSLVPGGFDGGVRGSFVDDGRRVTWVWGRVIGAKSGGPRLTLAAVVKKCYSYQPSPNSTVVFNELLRLGLKHRCPVLLQS